ncbi:plasmid stabilization protein [Azospirillum sp. INR13]|uniref:FitA-like ribbon-helix-helix domain-containing protein n=1 Tax=unclassified Azospirillum TaxID=2630922 RepID=UPI001891F3BD|nr:MULTISPECIES: plasmid stabilization protein [unclassified Azospirillum]MBF5093560.1 plasmid stabilization protein [Azospirillum sp. INR13]MDR6774182.1 plasmid stability protein [Azospirillum sp. BE72]
MASITIRNLEDPLKARLRIRAAHHGRSMEDEARHILRAALTEENQPAPDLGEAIHQRFARLDGVDLAEVERAPLRTPPNFD